nr:3-oxoacyl-[acyl-carrier-protein] reductase fabg [Quercus suber]
MERRRWSQESEPGRHRRGRSSLLGRLVALEDACMMPPKIGARSPGAKQGAPWHRPWIQQICPSGPDKKRCHPAMCQSPSLQCINSPRNRPQFDFYNMAQNYLSQDRGDSFRSLGIAMAVVPTISLTLRFWARAITTARPKFWWDDALAFCAWVSQPFSPAERHYLGLEKHIEAVTLVSNTSAIRKLLHVSQITFDLAIATGKFSVLCFYLRVFTVHGRRFKWAFWTTFALVAIFISYRLPTQIFLRSPPQKNWKPETPGRCDNNFTNFGLLITGLLLDVITDLMILVLPMPTITGLQMKKDRKIMLTWITSIGRMSAYITVRNALDSPDFTSEWSCLGLSLSRMMDASGIALIVGAERGARGVVFADINFDAVGDAVEESKAIATALEHQALAIEVDVTSRQAVRSMITRTISNFGRIDYAVNCAGVPRLKEASLDQISDEESEFLHDVNRGGILHCLQEEIEVLKSQEEYFAEGRSGRRSVGQGSIIIITSLSAMLGTPKSATYVASKCAARDRIAYQRDLARIHKHAYADQWPQGAEKLKAMIDESMPLGRTASPEEIAGVAHFLATPSASYVHGESIVVDSGLSVAVHA